MCHHQIAYDTSQEKLSCQQHGDFAVYHEERDNGCRPPVLSLQQLWKLL